MGAYFRCYKRGKFIIKTLIKKKGGSPYPDVDELKNRIELLKKHLGDLVPKTEVSFDGKRIRMKQEMIWGVDIFPFLKKYKSKRPKQFDSFIQRLNVLYKETGILPDLINQRNILVSNNNSIKIVDVWPLFFKERVMLGDITQESYEENLERFLYLKNAF